MQWEEFKSNVQGWAKERGIYQSASPLAQLMKAGSEVGDLLDAILKDDSNDVKDAIGDVAVCMVNYAYLAHSPLEPRSDDYERTSAYAAAALLTSVIGDFMMLGLRSEYEKDAPLRESVMLCLGVIADSYCLDFMDCCESAWNEIKGRKGEMANGAFVKDATQAKAAI